MKTARNTRVAYSILLSALIGVVVGCAGEMDRAPVPVDPSLPRLEQILIPVLDSIGPESSLAGVAVSESGRVAFTSGFDPGNRMITVIDTAGRLVHRLAQRGHGPGEIDSERYVSMEYSGDTLIVWPVRPLLYTFGPDGELLATSRTYRWLSDGGAALRLRPDSSDFTIFNFETRMHIPAVMRASTAGETGRTLLTDSDPRHDSLRAASPWALTLSRPLASNAGMFIVSDPVIYRFQSYDRHGTPL
jgi:hypothetical protein